MWISEWYIIAQNGNKQQNKSSKYLWSLLMVDVEHYKASVFIFPPFREEAQSLIRQEQHALWAVFHDLFGPISLMETNASTAGLWNERTFHWYATTGEKTRQVKWNVSSAIINAPKNTPLGMCSKYCSGEMISDRFFQWTCRSSAGQFMFPNIPEENAEGWQLIHNNTFA